jgi:hypothetical protein
VSNPEGDFQIEADNVTINGFTLEGVTANPSSDPAALGAAVWTNPGFSGTHGGTQVVNNIIQGNIAGIELDNDGTYQTAVEHNLFRNNNQPGPNGGLNIEVDFGLSKALIDGNTFTNASFVENSWALGVEAPGDHITFSNNAVSNQGRGVFFFGTTSSTVSDNSFTGASHYAVGAFGGVNGLTVNCNTIQGGNIGLDVEDDLGSPGTPDPNSNIKLNFNSLVGNTTSVLVSNAGSSPDGYAGTLDATNNWWGSPGGPAAGAVVDNVSGSSVNYTPWLVTPPGTSTTLFWKDAAGDVLTADPATGNYAFFLAGGGAVTGTGARVQKGVLKIHDQGSNGQKIDVTGPASGEVTVNLRGKNKADFTLDPFNPMANC